MSDTSSASDAAPRSRLVVGCGYLGERVARLWLARGDRVLAVTRRPARAEELARHGIEPLIADVTTETGWTRVRTAEDLATAFWAVGFDRTAGSTHRDVHVVGLGRLLDALPSGCRPLLSSSTGVWGDEAGRIVDESTPPSPSREAGRVLVEAEQILQTHPRGPGVALRFAGLYGPGRLPRIEDLRAGRPLDANPDSWLNMIHVDDAAAVVAAVADAPQPAPLYVVSDGRPVLRRDWYGRLAEITGSPPPTWNDPGSGTAGRGRLADKRVDPSRLVRELGFAPRYPDAATALGALVADAAC